MNEGLCRNMQNEATIEKQLVQRALWSRVWARLMGRYNKLFRNRNYVFVFDESSPAPSVPPGMRVERYDRIEAIPEHIHRTRCRERGATAPDAVEREIESVALEMQHGAVYWAIYIDDRLVGKSMTRRGSHFRRWLVPLGPRDVVHFSGVTFPAFRGRNVHPARLRYIIEQELEPGGHFYVDCKVYNTSVRRSFEKAGFRKIATAKPLTFKDFFG